jgi:multiple antibiotic resistance protein
MKILSMAYALFLLMDPIGNIPLFISILKDIEGRRQRQIILRELLIALGVMIAFNFLGDALLRSLNVSQYAVLISGGIILFILSLKMIFPSRKDADVDMPHEKEPFIVPLAIPLVAGPAVLAAIILFGRQEENNFITISAIAIAWAASTLILLGSSFLKKVLGWRGIMACERLMGLLLTMLAIQMFLEGVTDYLAAIRT